MQPFNKPEAKYKAEFIFHERFADFFSSKLNAFTLAVVFTDTGAALGIAQCSEKDQFNKKIGRLIALGRARKEVSRCQPTSFAHLTKKELYEIARKHFLVVRQNMISHAASGLLI